MTNKVKTHECRVCKAEFIKSKLGQKVCSPKCAFEHVVAKRSATNAKAERKAVKEAKERLKTRRNYIDEAEKAVCAFIRARDEGKPCISCGKPLIKTGKPGGDYDAGHYRSKGSAAHLRLTDTNIHGQCKKCNNQLAGNVVEYRKGLVARYGTTYVEAIEADQTPRKWSIDELKAIRDEYRKKLKELTRGT